jgi:hypothetical protein
MNTLSIPITSKKGNLFIIHNGWPYDLSASQLVKSNLSPAIRPVDEFLKYASKLKGISDSFCITLQDEWFFFCDGSMIFSCPFLGGWIYNIEAEKTKLDYNQVWICPYIKLFFEEPPKKLYLKIGE